MKKVYILLLICTFLYLFGCNKQSTQTQTQNVENSFQTEGNGRITWFKLTPNNFLKRINEVATKKGYKELKPLKNDDETSNDLHMFSNNGDTWYINVSTYDSKFDPKQASNKVYEVKLSLFAEDEDRAKMNGFYLNSLINMFNPGLADKVTEDLYIYKEAPEGTDDSREVICGNVVYTYIFSKGNTPEFHIRPVNKEVTTNSNVSPIKP